jgi:hypothetical protein
MSDTTSENPYESPQAIDEPPSGPDMLGHPVPGLRTTVGRFRAERSALAVVFGIGCLAAVCCSIAVVSAAITDPLLAGHCIGHLVLTPLLVVGYALPLRWALQIGILAVGELGIASTAAIAWNLWSKGFDTWALIAFPAIPLLLILPLFAQTLRIERYARQILAAGYPLKVTSLQVISDEHAMQQKEAVPWLSQSS